MLLELQITYWAFGKRIDACDMRLSIEKMMGETNFDLTRAIAPLFIFFCMCPFLLPIPGLDTNMQMYACLFGIMVILLNFRKFMQSVNEELVFAGLLLCLCVATLVAVFSGLSISTFRGYFNHLSILVIPVAAYIVLKVRGFDEKLIKSIILIWFSVSLIQLIFYRGFLAEYIGSPNWASTARGVIGLASEPSFLGITCFYFLNLAKKFESRRTFFLVLITVMGVVLAQSAVGIVFIAAFWFAFLFEELDIRKGLFILIGLVVVAVLGYIILSKFGNGTRLFVLLNTFLNSGLGDLYANDESFRNRMNAVVRALSSSTDAYFLPQGFGNRIGSGYGGILCEIGFFSLIQMVVVSLGMARTFSRRPAQIVFFVMVTLLLFSNTQIGNPQLLLVVGLNYGFYRRSHEPSVPCISKVHALFPQTRDEAV